MNSEIRLPSSEVYEINPADFFQSSINVTKEGADIAKLEVNWRGEIAFSFQDQPAYLLKSKGVFDHTFMIEDNDGQNALQFDPECKWKKFTYHYKISHHRKPDDILPILLGVYACNYSIAILSGASSGMG